MKLLVEWSSKSLVLEPKNSYLIGRDEECALFIDSSKVSRRHARLFFKNGNWVIQDLNSSNGTFAKGKKLNELILKENLKIHVGGDGLNVLTISFLDKNVKLEKNLDATRQVSVVNFEQDAPIDIKGRIRLQKQLRIGRDPLNDWVIDSPNASRMHAEILQNGSNFELVDLKSTNGTFVNGLKVSRATLNPGDEIAIAGIKRTFTYNGLEPVAGVVGTDIRIKNLSYRVGNKTLIDKVNLNLGPRTLTAIIGPSGAGKSTLLALLAGRLKPASGAVEMNGYDFEKNYQYLSKELGLVPQSDILHTNLTVSEALKFGASLRLPDDSTKADRQSRVEYVMEKLELSERANLRIDKLSGGQRKRASIGLELLTSPQVLLLDEPTSGLDPGLDAHVMETLRTLADDGQTVVVVTHSVDNLDYCDNVVLLAAGGKLIYFGPVSSVFKQLGKKSWAEVFRLLASPEAYALAIDKHDSPIDSRQLIGELDTSKKSKFKQISTLTKRYLKVITADRFYLSLLTIIPVLIGLIAFVAGSKYGFGGGYKSDYGYQVNPYAQGTILILILGSVFIGLATSIQEIIKENAIRVREQAVGIGASSYLLSKLIVLCSIILIQMIIFVTIVLFGRPVSASGLLISNSRLEIIMICSILGISAMVFGLMISSLLTSNEQAMPALVGATMVQVVLSGALPLSSSAALDLISKFSPSFWATNALASSINLVQISRVLDKARQARWESSIENLRSSLLIVALMGLLFYCVTYLKLRKIKRG